MNGSSTSCTDRPPRRTLRPSRAVEPGGEGWGNMAIWLVEGAKIIGQIVAVTLGVFLGWRLNGKSQAKARLLQARADWGAAAESCLGTIHALVEANPIPYFKEPDAYDADRKTRQRKYFEDLSAFRSATMRVFLLSRKTPPTDLGELEKTIVGIAPFDHKALAEINKCRERVHQICKTWSEVS